MGQIDFEEVWERIEKHGAPCKVRMSCWYKKTYTGPGKEYTPLWSICNEHVSLQLEELRRGHDNVLWGRLKTGDGWIDLKDTQLD